MQYRDEYSAEASHRFLNGYSPEEVDAVLTMLLRAGFLTRIKEGVVPGQRIRAMQAYRGLFQKGIPYSAARASEYMQKLESITDAASNVQQTAVDGLPCRFILALMAQ